MLIKPFKILVVNPNTSVAMTEALIAPINALSYNNTDFTFHTNPDPSAPGSINDLSDAEISTTTIVPSLEPLLDRFDGFLVACFSPHPLVQRLREMVAASSQPSRPVTGIFEAAIAAATDFTPADARWTVVTTAEAWREPLSIGIGSILGFANDAEWDYRCESFYGSTFGGVETTGLTAGELHDTPREIVDQRMAEALGRLVDEWETRGPRVGVVVLGCAGMVGWEEKVRLEMKRRFGNGHKAHVLVVDPVKAGIGSLQSALRAGF